ncbi:PAS domain S-box protein [Clostridium felsineum]|uniref:MASE3 domain-containing sensor histidine kinase n=1 Tax=Clostridium felsineum TaxID=36839 RepID=UPI00214D7C50|nr:ATP-binding protein [Clostridium felsineum]MCR3759941.1 PAS domain S-box protein [Clostridium felsineum]
MFSIIKNKLRDENFVVNNLVLIGVITVACNFVGKVNYVLLYFFIEVIIAMLALNIFVNAISNYKYTKNILVLTIGIAYMFMAIFDFSASFNVLYKKEDLQYVYKIIMLGVCVDAFSFLYLSTCLRKKIKSKYSVICYGIVSVFLSLVTYDYKFFDTYLKEIHMVRFVQITKIVCVICFVMSFILFLYRKKKIMDNVVCIFMISSVFRAISIAFVEYGDFNNLVLYVNIIFKILAVYIIHREIIIKSVLNPYKDIYSKIKEVNEELNNKNVQLEKINKRLARENEIKESVSKILSINSKRYMQILQIMPDSILIHENGKCTFVNNMARKLLEVKEIKDIIGKNIEELVHDDYKKLMESRINKIKVTGFPCDFIEEKVITSSGKEKFVEAATATFSHEEGTFLTIFRDLTEKKKNEANEKKLKETLYYDKVRKEFFSNLSHELRTPLNILTSSMQLIKLNMENGNKESLKKYLKVMNQNVYRLTKIIDNLIDITKIDAGYFNIELKNVEIVSVIEDITMSVIEFVKSKGIDIVFDTDVEEKFMAVDPDKIERIMLNLLSNAVKFTQQGGKIKVNVYDNKDSVEIRVKDNGIGIPKDMKDRIFQRFIQVNKTLTREKEGSGIGLSIVKSLVEMHGGKVRVESKVSLGSEFIIDLPAMQVEDDNENIIENNKFNQKQKINVEFSDL